jgi:hypothetical protein
MDRRHLIALACLANVFLAGVGCSSEDGNPMADTIDASRHRRCAAGTCGTIDGGAPPDAGAIDAPTGGKGDAAADGGPDAGGTGGGDASVAAGGGIAAKYPGDVGIENDPDVIFADGFESYSQASDLWQRWDNVYQVSQILITTTTANVRAGAKAVELHLPQQTTELANAVAKVLATEQDTLYLRYYSKFDTSFDVSGSSHNGGSISAHYYINGQATPGIPANGTNKFLANYEFWREQPSDTSPGAANVYLYYPEQRTQWGDHFFPTGVVLPYSNQPYDFGAGFVSRPDFTPVLGRWYCYEFMVKANTPGVRDGRITLWLDGQVIADFPNLRLRDVDTLKIDHFELDFHAGSNPSGPTKKWYDAVVAAKRYIGPMAP